MSDYKRLTVKDKEYGYYVQNQLSKLNEPSVAVSCYGKIHGTVINRLAELENKIENGTFIELPCKVGDTVYWLIANKYIIECVVSLINISVGKKTHFTVWAKQKCEGVENDFSSDDLGEEWFITRAEAEKRSKELQNANK